MKKSSFFIFFLSFLASCAQTNIVGYRDNENINRYYSYPVVEIRIDDLHHRQMLENIFVDSFQKYSLNIIRGTDMFPPTRNLNPEELMKLFTNSKADSLLVLSLKSGSTELDQKWDISVFGKDIGKTVWAGESKTTLVQGNLLDSKNIATMFESMSSEIVAKLIQAQVFIPKSIN